MRVYISLDMEGMPGTWNFLQEKTDRNSVRKVMNDHTEQVIKAIIESTQNEIIEEIVIADSHANCDNISYDITKIDKRIKLISGEPRPNFMMPAFDDRFDMVFFLGYHSGYGIMNANMEHTYSNSRFHRILINEMPMCESLINAGYAGYYGVPVTLISGDLSLWKSLQNEDKMPWVEFIVTKEAIAKYGAINYSSLLINERIKSAVSKVLGNASFYQNSILKFKPPISLKIEFKSTAMADTASLIPHCKRLDGRTIEYTEEDYRTIFEVILAFRALASTTDL